MGGRRRQIGVHTPLFCCWLEQALFFLLSQEEEKKRLPGGFPSLPKLTLAHRGEGPQAAARRSSC